jgi:hypothetical protein
MAVAPKSLYALVKLAAPLENWLALSRINRPLQKLADPFPKLDAPFGKMAAPLDN